MILPIKFKKLNKDAKIPTSNELGSIELYAASERFINTFGVPTSEYDTGLEISIPKGHVGIITPLSDSHVTSTMFLANTIQMYGEGKHAIKVFCKSLSNPGRKYNVGDKIAQMVIIPVPTIELELT